MKTIEELKNFFDKELIIDLKVLEKDRLKVVKKVIILNICFSILVGISALFFFFISFFVFFIIIPVIILWLIIYSKFTKNYVSDFKVKVIARIIKFLDNNLNYEVNRCVSESIYLASRIFPKYPDRYNGDDLVYGKYGNTTITFSEIHSEYKTETRTKNGSQEHWHTIFKGIFFIADFNKKFICETLVLPDKAQKLFGNLFGNFFQSLNKSRGELIKMEDPDFEKLFVVYSNDQIEARYILTTSLMKRIVDFKNKTNKDIYLSFINNQVFVAISYLKNLFEPNIFKTMLDFNIIKEYYNDLQLAIGIVEELNLNTRIWG